MPKNHQKIMEETPDDPQVENRIVATCIRLYERDLEKFQKIPELQGTMSRHLREFTHDFLNHNGFSDIALMNRKRELQQEKREIDQQLYTIDKKLTQNLTAKFKEEQELLQEGKVEMFMGEIIATMAETVYFNFRSNEIMTVGAKLGPTLAWVKGRLTEFKDIPGFDMTPGEIQSKIKEIIESNRERWDEKWEQDRDKFLSHKR